MPRGVMRGTTPCLYLFLPLAIALLVACGDSPTASTAPTATDAARAASAAPAASTAPATSPPAAPASPATAASPSDAAAASPIRPSGTPATPVAAAPKIGGSLTIFAASSLIDAFNEMKGLMEAANPGTTITFNYAASSALRTQLEQGARADLFASADTAQMNTAKQGGLIPGDLSVFVRNTPVIIVPANNPKGIATPQDLARPGIKLVLAAPEVPIGNYARQVLGKMSKDPDYGADFGRKVLANLASNEASVRQVVSKVQLGEGDAGIVYASDVTPAVRAQVKIIPIPENVNVIAEYPLAVVKGAGNPAGAQAFLDYVLSPAGQAILQRWGFVPVRPTASGGVVALWRVRD